MTRTFLGCTVVALAIFALAGSSYADPPLDSGRWLGARAHHAHGNRGPQPPTSPAGQGSFHVEGFRVYQASALHPFLVGFYEPGSEGIIDSTQLLIERRGRHRGHKLWLNVPLSGTASH